MSLPIAVVIKVITKYKRNKQKCQFKSYVALLDSLQINKVILYDLINLIIYFAGNKILCT